MLSRLIDPATHPDAFVADTWTRQPHLAHRPLADAPGWIEELAALGLPAIAALPATRVVAMYVDREGLQKTLPAEPRHALTLYRDHECTLCMSDLALPEGAARDDLAGLARSLGVPADAAQINLYASPLRGGLAPHWDRTDAFVVQLSGAKTWWYAPNTAVEHPRHNHVPGAYTTYEVRTATARCAPPESAAWSTAELEPGSVLYLPRGYWHATRATAPSVSIAIKIKPLTWAELLLRYLECELDASPAWRESVVGVWGDPRLRPRALARLDQLLAGWRGRLLERPLAAAEVVRAINPKSELGAAVEPDATLARNPAVRIELANGAAAGTLEVRVGLPAGAQTVLEVDETMASVVRRASRLGGACSVADLIAGAAFPEGSRDLLALLVEAGALSIVAEPAP